MFGFNEKLCFCYIFYTLFGLLLELLTSSDFFFTLSISTLAFFRLFGAHHKPDLTTILYMLRLNRYLWEKDALKVNFFFLFSPFCSLIFAFVVSCVKMSADSLLSCRQRWSERREPLEMLQLIKEGKSR